jgi:hypothetical protein
MEEVHRISSKVSDLDQQLRREKEEHHRYLSNTCTCHFDPFLYYYVNIWKVLSKYAIHNFHLVYIPM